MADKFAYLCCILPNRCSPSNLHLDCVHVSVDIVDVHAQVILSQRFTNTYQITVEATYSFAMLASAAVCGFEMVRGDGTRVNGRVMEKTMARETYNKAVSQGQTAGLGEEQTKDVFSIKVGNIQPNETVTINLTFLSPLIDDEKQDQIRFTFPRGYAMRYGEAPSPDAASAMGYKDAAQKFSFKVFIQQSSAIKSISCPSSHPIELSLGIPDHVITDPFIPESNFASVNLSTASPHLTQDFILVITVTGLDSPRCFIEPHPSPNENTTALGLTFVPRFNIPDVRGGMEYIFVVDRSGSMSGSPIKLLREALVVLLRGLPTNSTKFNIFSFGSHATSLWKSSQEYTQASLDRATQHIDTMQADYGGTEIANALRLVFGSLPKERKQPVSVFLLTDGGAWDVSTCETLTRGIVQSPGAFVRIFTVGIGSGVSTETVESIARAGEGLPIYIHENEPMTGKLARLVRAARTPAIQDIQVFWPQEQSAAEDVFEFVEDSKSERTLVASAPKPSPPINLFNYDDYKDDKEIGPPPSLLVKPEDISPPAVQQAPLTICRLFPGTRVQIFAIVSSISGSLPSIKVRGQVATTGDVVELDVEVVKVMSTRAALIHTLAARALITDREDGKHVFPASISSKSHLLSTYLEADIIRLGTRYGLASRHTSYVAIDERTPNQFPSLNPLPNLDQLSTSYVIHQDTGGHHSYAEISAQSNSAYELPPLHAGILSRSAKTHRVKLWDGSSPASAPGGSLLTEPRKRQTARRGVGNRPPLASQRAVRRAVQVDRSSAVACGGRQDSPIRKPEDLHKSVEKSPSIFRTMRGVLSSTFSTLMGRRTKPRSQVMTNSVPHSVPPLTPSVDLAVDSGPPSTALSSAFDSAIITHCDTSNTPGASTSATASPQLLNGRVSSPGTDFAPASNISYIARLQQFDGHFSITPRLLRAIGTSSDKVKEKVLGVQVSDDVVATVLAVIWMCKYSAREETQDMIDKAEGWLKGNVHDEALLEELKSRVARLL